MKKEAIINRQKELLQKLAEELKKMTDVVEFVPADDEVLVDSLLTEHEDLGIGNDTAVGQYYFAPVVFEEADVEQFVIMLNISDELKESKKVDMLQAITFVNYLLPTGAFIMDPALDILTYKRGVTLAVTDEDEKTLGMILYEILNAVNMVSVFVAPLLAYMEDDVNWEEFVEACSILLDPSGLK